MVKVEKDRQQVAGICASTGLRLSDAQVLQNATDYAFTLAKAHGADRVDEAWVKVRIVPEAEVRAEERVPRRVRRAGGFRAYVRIDFEPSAVTADVAKGLDRSWLLVVSNCGDLRFDVQEDGGFW